MGSRRPALPHLDLIAALKADDLRSNPLFQSLQSSEPVYQSLLELLEICRQQTRSSHPETVPPPPQTFAELEELLLKIYGGNASAAEAGQIIAGLQTSPNFYRLLLRKLEALTPHVTWETAQNAAEIPLHSAEEVLTLVRRASNNLQNESPGERAWRKLKASAQLAGHTSLEIINTIASPRTLAVAVLLCTFTLATLYNSGVVGPPPIAVHYPPDSFLRGADVIQEYDAYYYDFRDTFLLAMSDYVINDYKNTLKTLASLAPKANVLYAQRDQQNHAALLREYYFYTGITHLALSQERSLFSKQPKLHAASARAWLLRADSLAQADSTSKRSRETYFLGLAYGLNDEKSQAVTELQKIPRTSPLFEDSAEWIHKWSKP